MKIMLLLIFLVGFAGGGCSFYRVDSESTTLDFYPPKTSAQDVTYLKTLDKPYEVIGMVTVSAEKVQPFEEVLTRIKYEASVIGGDAVTDIRQVNQGIRTRYTAKAVVFK